MIGKKSKELNADLKLAKKGQPRGVVFEGPCIQKKMLQVFSGKGQGYVILTDNVISISEGRDRKPIVVRPIEGFAMSPALPRQAVPDVCAEAIDGSEGIRFCVIAAAVFDPMVPDQQARRILSEDASYRTWLVLTKEQLPEFRAAFVAAGGVDLLSKVLPEILVASPVASAPPLSDMKLAAQLPPGNASVCMCGREQEASFKYCPECGIKRNLT